MIEQADEKLKIGANSFSSRLIIGTGKYKDFNQTAQAITASDCQLVTVAVRRVSLSDRSEAGLLEHLPAGTMVLPNTAGCFDAKEAVRTCELAREMLDGQNLVKLEVLGDQETLYPNIPETLIACEQLIAKGFEVMVYTSDDPIIAKQLAQMGAVAVMPLASLIGSGKGIINPYNLQIIVEQKTVPIIVDAGVGIPADAALAMQLGCDGILMNTAIAKAKHPIQMAQAMRHAVIAGRLGYLAGAIRSYRPYRANASSPQEGMLDAS